MEIDCFPDDELDQVFRVLRTALNDEPALSREEQAFLSVYSRITGFQLSALPERIKATEVQITDAHRRKRLVQLAAVAALLSRPVRPRSVQFVSDLAENLRVQEPVIRVLYLLSRGRTRFARFLTARRGLRVMAKEAWLSEGLFGVLRFFGALFLGFQVNKERVWDYKRLGLLPEGTLGREYWKHLTELGFSFPGEPQGIPQTVAYHDISHVLTENDTTPLGEIQQGSFQAGNRRDGGFFFLQFVILQFHQGIRITPAAPPDVGNFDPEKVLWAIHRGASCTVDMTHQWNYWPLMKLPLAEARSRCGLLPRLVK